MKRHPRNPILTRADIPDVPPFLVDATSVFNPGAVRFGDKTVLMLRVQSRGRRTFFMVAESADGVSFRVRPELVRLRGLESVRETVYHCYDARITPLDGAYYLMFAMDMDSGCRLGLARTTDFESFDFLGLVSDGDSRNGVLFPEKVGGEYVRLERPNRRALSSGQTTGDVIVLSASRDLMTWREVAPVAAGRFHYWDEYVGAGPTPVKTARGWLQLYHGVATHLASIFIYQAGVLLLDLADPSRVLGRSPDNVLEPREPWELAGQVPNVVFPSGAVVDPAPPGGSPAGPDARVRVYYGAADTCVGLAEATVGELTAAALAPSPEEGPR